LIIKDWNTIPHSSHERLNQKEKKTFTIHNKKFREQNQKQLQLFRFIIPRVNLFMAYKLSLSQSVHRQSTASKVAHQGLH
jgi:hypothetical protein